MSINVNNVDKACTLIAENFSVYLSKEQMIELLQSDMNVFSAVNMGGLDGQFTPADNNPIFEKYTYKEYFNDIEGYTIHRHPNVKNRTIMNVVREEVLNHFHKSLFGIPQPSSDMFDDMSIEEEDEYNVKLIDLAIGKGYRYSTHPDGPDADEA